ncbi:MAG: ArdC family protein [Saprospiraceae bacterium]
MTTQTKSAIQTDLYTKVTEKIIAMLECGTIPWRKPWSGYGLARNYATGHIYTGINLILMNNTDHSIPCFMTFKQIKEQNGSIRKGAKAEMVMYFNVVFKDKSGNKLSAEEAGSMNRKEVQVFRFLKYYNVFNVADIEGIEFTYPGVDLQAHEKIEKCENIIRAMPQPPEVVEYDSNRCYYNSVQDYVNMAEICQFQTPEDYYATFFHELCHATGHEKRLARPAISNPTKFGSEAYSEEELVAEIGASFLCASVGIDYQPVMDNAAAYIQGWLKVLKKDKTFIFKASAEAQKAADFILGTYGRMKA